MTTMTPRKNMDDRWDESTAWIYESLIKTPPTVPPVPLDEDGNVDPVKLAIRFHIACNALKMIGGGPPDEKQTHGVFTRKLIAAYTLAMLDNKDTWNLTAGNEPFPSDPT